MRQSIWGKNHISLQTCLTVFVISKRRSKKGFCVDGLVTPIQKI